MTSSATQDFLHEIVSGGSIPDAKLAYFGATLCNLFHQAMLIEFEKAEKNGLTKRELARRIGKKPEQITRWLSYPGNLTLDTIAEILVGMGIQVENLGLANLASGARVRFPHYEETSTSPETQTPIRIIEQKSNTTGQQESSGS
jgi:DNA-binding phage protein